MMNICEISQAVFVFVHTVVELIQVIGFHLLNSVCEGRIVNPFQTNAITLPSKADANAGWLLYSKEKYPVLSLWRKNSCCFSFLYVSLSLSLNLHRFATLFVVKAGKDKTGNAAKKRELTSDAVNFYVRPHEAVWSMCRTFNIVSSTFVSKLRPFVPSRYNPKFSFSAFCSQYFLKALFYPFGMHCSEVTPTYPPEISSSENQVWVKMWVSWRKKDRSTFLWLIANWAAWLAAQHMLHSHQIGVFSFRRFVRQFFIKLSVWHIYIFFLSTPKSKTEKVSCKSEKVMKKKCDKNCSKIVASRNFGTDERKWIEWQKWDPHASERNDRPVSSSRSLFLRKLQERHQRKSR